MENTLITILALALAMIFGFFLGRVIPKIKTSGTLKIDTSDPLSDRWSFEMTDDLCTIPRKKQITLRVQMIKSDLPENTDTVMDVLNVTNKEEFSYGSN